MARLAPRVISEQVHYQIVSMMKDVIRLGTARRALKLGRKDIAGKTGTTNEQHDAWFNGFNQDLVTTTWVGFDRFAPLGRNETGGRAALPMWIEYMGEMLSGRPEQQFEQPDGMVTIRINPKTGQALAANEPGGIFETFRKGLEPEAAESGPGGTAESSGPDGGDLRENLF